MASTYLTRTFTGSNKKKWTWSAWVKRHSIGSIHPLFHSDDGTSNYYTHISFHDTDQLFFQNRWNNGNDGYKITTRMFRDTGAFYHLQFVWDSANATADDRQIIYVNGERLTLFGGANVAVTQDRNTTINDGYEHRIGRGGTGFNNTSYADVTLSHVHFADGQALAPTVFGETDSTTGEWKIKTSPSFTLGTTGFTILKDGNTVTDQSTNSNNWSVGAGTLISTQDCPSNNFATWNNLQKRQAADKLATEITPSNDTDATYAVSTLGASSGKYYFEFESNSGNGRASIGMVWSDYATSQINDNSVPGANAYSFAFRQYDGVIAINNTTSSYGTNLGWSTTGEVLMMAIDLDNNLAWFGVDGTWQNSGDPSNGTNGFDWSAVRIAGQPYLVLAGDDTASGYGNIQANFGNGYFGTDAIASEGTNASGIGKFEYDVPTGFTALSTKGLNE